MKTRGLIVTGMMAAAFAATANEVKLIGADNIPVPEKFFRRGSYRLKGGSPLVNAGFKEPWMDDATDFYGFPRVFNRLPDIGCAECQAGGMTILLR